MTADAAEAADTDVSPAAPPNLRAAEDESKECGNCVYFDRTHCTKFPPLCVSDEWVCDAWRAGGKDTDEGPAPPAAKTIRDAQRIALAHARAQKQSRIDARTRQGTAS
jgi:hypothetical protein